MCNDELNRLSNNILLVYDGLVEDESIKVHFAGAEVTNQMLACEKLGVNY